MKHPMLACLLLPLLGGVAWAEDPPQGPPPAPVEVARVVEQDIRPPRSFVGTVTPSRQSVVGSEVDGLVLELLVREGQRVEAEQPIARLRTTVIDARVAAAKAELLLRQKELLELENGARKEEVNQAEARVREIDAQIELRHWKYEAARKLADQKLISEDELRDAQLAFEAARRLQETLKASLELVAAGPRPERIEQAHARVTEQEAEVAQLEDEQLRHVIQAPFAGWVVAERTEAGQWLQRGAAVVELAALDQVDVVFPVLEDFVSEFRPGMPVTVAIPAIPELPAEVAAGKVEAVIPQADLRARTFPVKVRLKNRHEGNHVLVKPGMFARADVEIGELTKALLVPKDALVLGGPSPVVYVVDEGTMAAQPVPVTLGTAWRDMMQVTGPVRPGQQVVVRGNERLRPGQTVVVTAER